MGAFLMFCFGCAPSESIIQTAIAKTALSEPTKTQTPTTTPTLAPTLTLTPSITPSPTPDLRIINDDPQLFLLKANELPLDAKYFLPNSTWTSPHTNAEVVSNWTVKKGQEYIQRTGREMGWWVSYLRGTKNVIAPDEINISAIRFNRHAGAMLLISDYAFSKRYPELGWKIIDKKVTFSDDCNVEEHQQKNSGGDIEVSYKITCIYRNFAVDVTAYGSQSEVTHEFIEDIVKKVIEKLENADLVSP